MMFLPIDHAASDKPLIEALQAMTRAYPDGPASPYDRRPPARWFVFRHNRPMLVSKPDWPANDDTADIVIVDRTGSMEGITFTLGVRTHWDVLWHGEFRLFQPANGTARFVSGPDSPPMQFRIDERGALEAFDTLPYVDAADYRAGCERAITTLRAMISEHRRVPAC